MSNILPIYKEDEEAKNLLEGTGEVDADVESTEVTKALPQINSREDYVKHFVTDVQAPPSRIPDLKKAAERQKKAQAIGEVFKGLIDVGRAKTGSIVKQRGVSPYMSSTLQRLKELDNQGVIEDRIAARTALQDARTIDNMYQNYKDRKETRKDAKDYQDKQVKLREEANKAAAEAAAAELQRKIDQDKWNRQWEVTKTKLDNQNKLAVAQARANKGNEDLISFGGQYIPRGKFEEFATGEMAKMRGKLAKYAGYKKTDEQKYKDIQGILQHYLGEDALEDIQYGSPISTARRIELLYGIMAAEKEIDKIENKTELPARPVQPTQQARQYPSRVSEPQIVEHYTHNSQSEPVFGASKDKVEDIVKNSKYQKSKEQIEEAKAKAKGFKAAQEFIRKAKQSNIAPTFTVDSDIEQPNETVVKQSQSAKEIYKF